MYIKTPIYLRPNYLSYYFSKNEEYKFDIDDLFFYSQHKILRRGGRLFVNEYGMQTSIFSRYGIPSHGVPGRDFTFANNKAVDLAKRHGIAKNFPENYVEELSAKEYAELYTKIKISKKFLAYLDSMSSISD